MNTRNRVPHTLCVMLAMSNVVQAASLGPAVIAAGAARLASGSLVTLGQPFVALAGSGNGVVQNDWGFRPNQTPTIYRCNCDNGR